MTQTDDIRRHPDGSIDYGFYRAQMRRVQGQTLRAPAMRKLRFRLAGLLVAMLVAVGATASPSGPANHNVAAIAAPASGVATANDHAQALIRSRQWWESFGQRRSHNVAMAN